MIELQNHRKHSKDPIKIVGEYEFIYPHGKGKNKGNILITGDLIQNVRPPFIALQIM